MKWMAVILGGLIGLLGLMALLGYFMPREHVASRKARYKQKPDAIWPLIADPEGLPGWRTDVVGVEMLAEQNGHAMWKEKWRNGTVLLMERTEFVAQTRVQTRIANTDLAFGGTWTFELQADGEGSQLRITENGYVNNVIFRFLSRVVFGQTGSIEGFLRLAGTKFGESVTPEE